MKLTQIQKNFNNLDQNQNNHEVKVQESETIYKSIIPDTYLSGIQKAPVGKLSAFTFIPTIIVSCPRNFSQYISNTTGQESAKSKNETKQQSQKMQASVEKKKKKAALMKNYLSTVKRCLDRVIRSQKLQKDIRPEIDYILKSPTTNRQDIEKIYRQPDFRICLAKMFRQGKLLRELLLSRVDISNRRIFRQKSRLIQKSFIAAQTVKQQGQQPISY